MEPTLERINSQASRIKLYADKTLTNKFRIPVIMSDETARVIAMASIFRGGDVTVWLNESQLSVKNLRLELRVIYHPDDAKDYGRKLKMQGEE